MDKNIIDINKLLDAINDRDENWVSWQRLPTYKIVSPDERAERASKGILDKLQEAGRNGRLNS